MSQMYYEQNENSAGASLVAAREALNMSVSDVARHLKLSSAQVEALEAGAYERLPGRVFVRGFLRNYAKLLGMDPQALLLTIDREMPQPASITDPPASAEVVMPREKTARWPTYLSIAAAVIVGALAVYEFGFNDPLDSNGQSEVTSAENTSIKTAASESAAAAPAFPPGASGPEAPADSTLQLVPDTLPEALAASTPLMGAAAPGPVSLEATRPAAESGAAPTGQRALHFRFDQDSWLEVRDGNGKIIFAKLNPTGSEERVTGTPPFKLVVGNAPGVRLDYGATRIDLVPQSVGGVARLTLQ